MSAERELTALTRVTTRYVPVEDRIRLAGELEGGSQVAIWLTQRLLQRLLQKLLLTLEEVPNAGSHRKVLLAFAQQRALTFQQPAAPVEPPPEAEAWLAQRAAIAHTANVLTIIFESKNGQSAALSLSQMALRQWLATIYRAWRSAEWPPGIWPEWLKDALESKAPQPGALH